MPILITFVTAIILGVVAAAVMTFVNAYRNHEGIDGPIAAFVIVLLLCVIGGCVSDVVFHVKGWMFIPSLLLLGPICVGAFAGVCALVVFAVAKLFSLLSTFGHRTREIVEERRFHRDLDDDRVA